MGTIISFVVTVVLAVIVGILYEIFSSNSDTNKAFRKANKVRSNISRFLSNENIQDAEQRYEWPCNEGTLVVPRKSKTIAVVNDVGYRKLSIDDIISISIDKNIAFTTKTSTSNAVKRAAVGGVLGGGLGAVIGGTTASSVSESYVQSATVKIHTRDVDIHTIMIPVDSEATANQAEGLLLALKNQ